MQWHLEVLLLTKSEWMCKLGSLDVFEWYDKGEDLTGKSGSIATEITSKINGNIFHFQMKASVFISLPRKILKELKFYKPMKKLLISRGLLLSLELNIMTLVSV